MSQTKIRGWTFEDYGDGLPPSVYKDDWTQVIAAPDEDGDVRFDFDGPDYGSWTGGNTTYSHWVPLEVLAELLRRNGYEVRATPSKGRKNSAAPPPMGAAEIATVLPAIYERARQTALKVVTARRFLGPISDNIEAARSWTEAPPQECTGYMTGGVVERPGEGPRLIHDRPCQLHSAPPKAETPEPKTRNGVKVHLVRAAFGYTVEVNGQTIPIDVSWSRAAAIADLIEASVPDEIVHAAAPQQEEPRPRRFEPCVVSWDGDTLTFDPGPTTVRICLDCGVFVAGGPTRCRTCALAFDPQREGPRCECGNPKCTGPADNLEHQCGGPGEACGIAGCPECRALASDPPKGTP